MSLSDKRQELIDTFSLLPDHEERFRELLTRGRKYPAMAPALKTPDRLLPGCVSQLWMVPELRDGRCYFHMDADAMISKGLAAVMCGFYQGETPEDVATTEPDFLKDLGLAEAVSSNRSNGLASLRRRIKEFALQQSARG